MNDKDSDDGIKKSESEEPGITQTESEPKRKMTFLSHETKIFLKILFTLLTGVIIVVLTLLIQKSQTISNFFRDQIPLEPFGYMIAGGASAIALYLALERKISSLSVETKIFLKILCTLLIGGAIGGLTLSIQEPQSPKYILNCFGDQFPLGDFGYMIAGGASAIAVYLAIERLFGITTLVSKDLNPGVWLKIASVSVLAGFMGINLLNFLSTSILQKNILKEVEIQLIESRRYIEASNEVKKGIEYLIKAYTKNSEVEKAIKEISEKTAKIKSQLKIEKENNRESDKEKRGKYREF